MIQAVMTSPGKIEFNEIARPAIKENEVLIQIRRIGVCGSDIHVYHGVHPYTGYPVVQGHECAGVISEVGNQVSGFSQGDTVTFMPQVSCGVCYPCQHGMYHICDSLKVMGFQTSGAAQEFFPIEAEKVLKLPKTISLDKAAMIEPISVAVHATRRAGEDVQGKNILVLGAGTIGNLVAQVNKALGAARVMITDISDFKLEKARQVGLELTLNPEKEDLAKAIQTNFGFTKADVIFECVGVQDTITQGIQVARKGSTLVVVGVFGKKPVVDLGLVQDRELKLIGSLMYQRPDYEKAIELAAAGMLKLDEMISMHFPFERYLDAYHTIEAAKGNIMKVMIDLE